MRRVLRRILRPLGFVTPAGRTVLTLAIGSYVGARELGLDELALVAGLAGLVLLLALPFVLLPTRVTARIALRPTHTVAGETGQARLHVRNHLPLPLLQPEVRLAIGDDHVRLRLPLLRRGRERVVPVAVPTTRRGVITVGPVVARRTDPFGLLQRDARWGRATELYVRPRMVSLERVGSGLLRDQEGAPTDQVSMDDLAFHALREYVRGDDLRHVHWRSTARAGQLLVRQYHQTRRDHVTVLVDDALTSYADPDDFELAVSVAASLVVRAALDQTEVTFACGHELVTSAAAADVLDACCRVEAGEGRVGEAAAAARGVAPESAVLLVTGARGSGSGRLVVRAHGGGASALLDDEGVPTLQVGGLGDLPALLTALTAVTR